MSIINLHRVNTQNLGDLICAPALYFNELQDVPRLEILGFEVQENPEEKVEDWLAKFNTADHIIIGGGGLLGIDFFKRALNFIFSNKKKGARTILWGAGHNQQQINDWNQLHYQVDLKDYSFDLIGIRDVNHQGFQWVPCASCLSESFNKNYEIKSEFAVYLHADGHYTTQFLQSLPTGTKILTNHSTNFDEIISLIGSTNCLLTNSFHGAYWATLLGRKCIAFPSTSKFYSLMHPLPLCSPEDWKRFIKLATTYPDALDECRTANRIFAESVFDLINYDGCIKGDHA